MKRTPMPSRTTPMKRTEIPRQRDRMRPVSARRRKRDAFYPDARAQVWERAAGWCEVASEVCIADGQDVHHIAGRVGPDPHRLGNLLLACRPCHTRIHANPEWAYAHGWMASRLGGVA